jgi:hypothetical protein
MEIDMAIPTNRKPISSQEYEQLIQGLAIAREQMMRGMSDQLIENPQLAELLNSELNQRMEAINSQLSASPPSSDGGIPGFMGFDQTIGTVGATPAIMPPKAYDDTVAPERIQAVANLYYIYQHEMLGVFRVVLKLKELFNAGVVRLSNGEGADRLYKYDRREVLRYTAQERFQAYLRVFGYTAVRPAPEAMPNRVFHRLFSNFINQVALFFRDKRISQVVRERSSDPSFGSIAIVRRAGLDLRYNLRHFSYGHINILRLEVLQLLNDAFQILNAPDVRQLFGAANAWEVIEDVLRRYFGQDTNVSPRSRMGVAGQQIIQWLATQSITTDSRPVFEALLMQIADPCEEWLTCSQTLAAEAHAIRPARSKVASIA